jgi:hypothetical protein
MSEEVGTNELKELLSFVITLGESLESALADKKFEMAELALLMPALMKAGDAFTGLDKLGGEVKDLSEAEMADLVTFVKNDLDLANDNVEGLIEGALDLAAKIYAFVQMFKKDEAEATA